ncbi:hypothetical protein B0H14DRAFT_3883289 [Mycena olivaceomarginata]|nr:hypothetical protein B0H14DRAFT_3883289 [Mycena olivaceomarginata]
MSVDILIIGAARVEILPSHDPPRPSPSSASPPPPPLSSPAPPAGIPPALLQVALRAAADEEQRLALQAALEASLPAALQVALQAALQAAPPPLLTKLEGKTDDWRRFERKNHNRALGDGSAVPVRAGALPGRHPPLCESEYAHADHEPCRHRWARDRRARGILQSVLPRPGVHWRICGAWSGRGGRAGKGEGEGAEDTGCEGGCWVGWGQL